MKKYFIALAAYLVLSSSSCEKFADHTTSIFFANTSTDTVSVCYTMAFPDTSLKDECLSNMVVLVPANSIRFDKKDWSKFIGEEIPGNKVIFFVIPGAVNRMINSDRWPTVRDNYDVLIRYELTVQELDSLGWRVSYP